MQNNDLISRSALWKKFDEAHLFDDGNPRHIAQQIVEEAPAVDAAPVVHGYWFLTEPEYLNCSVCGNSYYTGIETLSMALDHLEFAGGHKFCPNCGAKMDGAKDG